jgi:hypothetical protein
MSIECAHGRYVSEECPHCEAARLRKTERPKLTRAQRTMLEQAILHNRNRIEYGVRAHTGGAIHRMLLRLRDRGLVIGPPWRVTLAGFDAVTR